MKMKLLGVFKGVNKKGGDMLILHASRHENNPKLMGESVISQYIDPTKVMMPEDIVTGKHIGKTIDIQYNQAGFVDSVETI